MLLLQTVSKLLRAHGNGNAKAKVVRVKKGLMFSIIEGWRREGRGGGTVKHFSIIDDGVEGGKEEHMKHHWQ